MSDDGWHRPARGWGWIRWAPPILCLLIGCWFLFSLTSLVGVLAGSDDVINRGTAEISSCQRDPVSTWMVYTCEADNAFVERGSNEHIVVSSRPLSGTVDVELVGVTRTGSEVVAVDRPRWSHGDQGLWAFLVILPGLGGFLFLGFFVSNRLSRVVPQAPPAQKGCPRRAAVACRPTQRQAQAARERELMRSTMGDA